MELGWQILIAVGLDMILGDPRRFPHPVRLIGKLALELEEPLRRSIAAPRIAGLVAVALVVGITGLGTVLLLRAADGLHPVLGDAVSILILYACFAARDLVKHSSDVHHALDRGDLIEARRRVAMLVGRDTDDLDEGEVARAAVESVAENTVDAVTAPLIFALVAGPTGAMAYKAINTLDSTFGYKNERYLQFGWASARLDDVVNFIPARLSALLVPPAAALLKMNGQGAWRIFLRDRKEHPSPNGGQIEAAMAGALGVRLGGLNRYFGQPSLRPQMGDPIETIGKDHIPRVNRLMLLTSALVLLTGLGCRWFIL